MQNIFSPKTVEFVALTIPILFYFCPLSLVLLLFYFFPCLLLRFSSKAHLHVRFYGALLNCVLLLLSSENEFNNSLTVWCIYRDKGKFNDNENAVEKRTRKSDVLTSLIGLQFFVITR